jgi:hypothetical protein
LPDDLPRGRAYKERTILKREVIRLQPLLSITRGRRSRRI